MVVKRKISSSPGNQTLTIDPIDIPFNEFAVLA
jgi:hypothetical protein